MAAGVEEVKQGKRTWGTDQYMCQAGLDLYWTLASQRGAEGQRDAL